jgi:hypothetical protein
MVKNKLVEAIKSNIKSVIPEIETFIKNCESIIALVSFTPVNLSIDYANHLNLFSKTRSPIRPDMFVQGSKRALSGERNIQRLIGKRLKLLL